MTAEMTAEMFLGVLPHRLSAIAMGAQAGDAAAVAAAAETLAAAGQRVGHVEVSFLSSAIAREARRGHVTHSRLVALVELCARLDAGNSLAA